MSERLKEVKLYAWVGEDELGSGTIGLKRGFTQVGLIPLVAVTRKVARQEFETQMRAQAKHCGKKIYLCRFSFEAIEVATDDGEPLA